MRALLHVCSLVLLVYGTAHAQTAGQPTTEASPPQAQTMTTPPKLGGKDTPEQIKNRGEAWFQQCMQDWDMATHMTKVEWERTCRRVALERTKFLIEQSK